MVNVFLNFLKSIFDKHKKSNPFEDFETYVWVDED